MTTLAHKIMPLGMGAGRGISALSMITTQSRLNRSSSFCTTSVASYGKLFGTSNSSLSSSCHCGIAQGRQNKTKGMRKSQHQLCMSLPLLLSSQTANISSSATSIMSAAAATQLSQASPSSTNISGVKVEGEKWDLVAGIVVERKPVITQKRDAFQQKYMDMLSKQEFEMSKKSDHELRLENDVRLMEKVKSGEIDLGGNVQTAKDDEDKWNAEFQRFEFGKRETDADLKKDTKSLERALDSHLLLVVEQKLGNEYRWICPHSKLQQGETLRQAADRMMQEIFPEMKTKVLGNAPWGFYKYKYPKSEVTNGSPVGAKVFFYKAQVVSGAPTIKKDSSVKDFVWLKRDELRSQLQPDYYKKLSECIIDN